MRKLIERRAQLETEIESQSFKISETLFGPEVETTEITKDQNEAEVIPYEKGPPFSGIPLPKGKLASWC